MRKAVQKIFIKKELETDWLRRRRTRTRK